MKAVRYIFILFLAFLFSAASGQSVLRLTLEECLNQALDENPQLALQELQLRQETMQIRSQNRFLVPEINGYANIYGYLDDLPVYVFPETNVPSLNGFVPLGAPMNFQTGFTVNQHLFDARMIGGRSVREKAVLLQEKRREMNEDEIRYEVIKTFYQLRILRESQEMISFNYDRLERLETVTRSAVENEMALPVTLEELSLRGDELDVAGEELENNLEKAADYLRFLCHLPQDVPLELVSDTDSDRLSAEIAAWEDSTSNNGWEILQLQKELAAESLQQKTSGTLPTLDLYMAFQWLQQEGYGDLFSSSGTWFNQHMIGLRLNIPILNPASRKSAVQETRIRQDILTAQQEMLTEQTRMNRENALMDMRLQRKELDIAARKVELSSKQYKQEEVRYSQEYSSLREILDAEERLRSARMEEQRKKIEYIISILEVYKAYGMLSSFSQSE